MKNVSTYSCVYEGCPVTRENRKQETTAVCFHSFPVKDINRCKQWIINSGNPILIQNIDNIDFVKSLKICDNHFRKESFHDVRATRKLLLKNAVPVKHGKTIDDDFDFPSFSEGNRNFVGNKTYLKKDAVPTLNLPKETENTGSTLKRKLERDADAIGFQKKYIPSINTSESTDSAYSIPGLDPHLGGAESKIRIEENVELPVSIKTECIETECFVKQEVESSVLLKESKGVQVESSDFLPKFIHFIKTDADLSTMTGLESFQVLDAIVELLEEANEADKFWDGDVDIRDRVLMTYMKLKQNFSYSSLAVMFHYSLEHCQSVFFDTLRMLDKYLVEAAIVWPSKQEISRNLPTCFEGFENTRVLLDCIEILVEEPEDLSCEINTSRFHKDAQIMKFLTGVCPDGNITYVSKKYDGHVIFPDSIDLHALLEPGDAIAADRDLLIDDLCEENQCMLLRPPVLESKVPFTTSETDERNKMAAAREYFEQINERLKTFNILEKQVSSEFIELLEVIFRVICATLNISSPILKDDEFVCQQTVQPVHIEHLMNENG